MELYWEKVPKSLGLFKVASGTVYVLYTYGTTYSCLETVGLKPKIDVKVIIKMKELN